MLIDKETECVKRIDIQVLQKIGNTSDIPNTPPFITTYNSKDRGLQHHPPEHSTTETSSKNKTSIRNI